MLLGREAAQKAGELAHHSLVAGLRSEETAKKLFELGGMTMRRARVIARTETSKAYTALTQARAASVGSEGYIWRTARDGATRQWRANSSSGVSPQLWTA